MLKLTDISHRFGPETVLSRVELTIHSGERVALMGPSGCGKTTLARIALGLIAPTEGTVENCFTKCVAVFQEPRLLPWRTAAENVNLVLKDDRTTMETAKKYLSLLHLQEAADKFPQELSGGMQQRVALARAMAAEGDFLVLDEPFKALDDTLRQQVMAKVAATTAAILLVTHDETEAQALGCKIINL